MKKSIILSFLFALFLFGNSAFASTVTENSVIVDNNIAEQDVITCRVPIDVTVMDCDGWTTTITLVGTGSNCAEAGAAVDEQICRLEEGGNSVYQN